MLSVPSQNASLSAPPSPYRMSVQGNINNAPPAIPNVPLAMRKLPQLSISVPTVDVINDNTPSSPTMSLAGSASSGGYPNAFLRMNSFRRAQSINTTPVIPSGLTASNSASSGFLNTPPPPSRSLSEPPPETKKSRRVNLGPGYSMICWAKKTRAMPKVNNEDVIITHEELSRHCTEDDAWMAVHGKNALFLRLRYCKYFHLFPRLLSQSDRVYNVTPYMKFHPGGISELMRGAGQDATILFDEVRSALERPFLTAKR